MGDAQSVPMQLPDGIVARAEAAATSQDRTVAALVSYWARLGMLIEHGASTDEHIMAAVQGTGQFAALTDIQRIIAHALIDVRIEQSAAAQSFGTATDT